MNWYQQIRHRIRCVRFKEYSESQQFVTKWIINNHICTSESVNQSVSQFVSQSVVLHSCSLLFLALSEHTQWETVMFDEDFVSRPHKGKSFLATTVTSEITLITSGLRGVVDGSGGVLKLIMVINLGWISLVPIWRALSVNGRHKFMMNLKICTL